VYATFVSATYEWITSTKVKPAKPTTECKIAVLVEPREHPLYEYVVKQVMFTLGSDWSLQLFVSRENEEYVRRILLSKKGEEGEHIVITRLSDFGLDMMSSSGNRIQSAFSAHQAMYHAIQGEYILWFQLDVILRHSLPTKLFQHAYIGSEWRGCEYPFCMAETCNRVCGGGNSGLSFRRRSKLLHVATKGQLPKDLWGAPPLGVQTETKEYFEDDNLHNNSETRWFEDDLQISFKLSKLWLLPPGEILPQFAVGEALPKEGIDHTNPCGLHKPWMTPQIHPENIERLLHMPYLQAKEGFMVSTTASSQSSE